MAKIEIDLLDTSLDNSGDGDHEIMGMVDDSAFGHEKKFLDSGEDDVACNYYRDQSSGTVTYRLVHIGSDEGGGGGGSGGSSHYSNSSINSNGPPTQTIPTVLANSVNGQLYVIGNPEAFGSTPINKPIIQRETHGKVTNIIKKRDDRRRATHNEVERRRRDKINNWIIKLAKMIPQSPDLGDKNSIEGQSKGGILAKACEYIAELKDNEQRLEDVIKDNERLTSEIVNLSMQLSTLRRNNLVMKNKLSQHGIPFNSETSDSGS